MRLMESRNGNPKRKHNTMNPLFKQMLSEGKIQKSDQLCAEEGCSQRLYELTNPNISDRLVINATRSGPFGYICDDCDNRKTQVQIGKVILSRR